MTNRVLTVSRIHTVAWPLLVAWPLGVLVGSFTIGAAIFAMVGDTGSDINFSGGVFSLFGFALAFYLQAMTQTFPFALGMSVTRRDYFAATLLVAAVQVLVFGVLLYSLSLIEVTTGGWGVGMRMFAIPDYFTSVPVIQLATYFAFLPLTAAAGLFLGALHHRWRVVGLFTLGVCTLLAAGAAAFVITWQKWWPDIGHWFADVPRSVPMVWLPALAAAAGILAAWTVVRRATA
ncbi:ABC transporter permease [Rhodococcus pseudokoreensis]|uniref:ABC transporter permease n=1 Tax=Rhodococcus pseudokoreensis TaxID=2811421 RepID=A0A974W1F0_9NOCA|nr:ABC transporter permease [Rhodococcus pseudokoreensis]QSE88608.1 ABC transporter permease [Rhodococcus pseudokoreensis]